MALRTLLLTDLVDSTKLAETLGDAAMADLWARHDRVARDLLVVHHGREIDKTDGFLLLFDRPEDGLAYATAYHAAIAPHGVRARAGLHVGEVILTENRPEDVARGAKPLEVDGLAKPFAARVMGLAVGGQTLVTASVVAALGDRPHVSHGFWRLKGVGEPVELFEFETPGAPLRPPPDAPKAWRTVARDGRWVPVKDVRHGLPAERDAFVGRDADLQAVARRLDETRLVTVLGVGGTGKTRLVTRFAWTWLGDYPGGAWFCDLAEARDIDGVAQAVARALDVPLAGGDVIGQLGHAIGSLGRCLLLLDNFEQVARFARATIGAWLDRAPEAQFVVTAREVLGVPGEAVVALAPLEVAEAVQLFEVRARQAHQGVNLDDRDVLERLATRLDGLPLAIELAAARVRVLPPRAILDRLSERFKLLASAGARHTRQATLRATLDWSWELLTPDERAALSQLSVFEGSFDLPAAEAVLVLSDTWAVDAVQALVDKSLLRRVGDERFGMLVSVQEYAAEKRGADVDVVARHGAWYASFGTPDAIAALAGPGAAPRFRALVADLDNLVAACRRALAREDNATAVDALCAAWEVLDRRGPGVLGVTLADEVIAAPLDAAAWARATMVRGRALGVAGNGAEAVACFEQLLAKVEGDLAAEARVLHRLGRHRVDLGQLGPARADLERGLAAARAARSPVDEALALAGLGVVMRRLGQFESAIPTFDEALAKVRALGDRATEGAVIANRAIVLLELGREEEAGVQFEAALAIHREVGNRRFESVVLGNLGVVHNLCGRQDAALTAFEQSLAIDRAIGVRRNVAYSLGNIGTVHLARGDLDAAEAALREAVAVAASIAAQGFEAGGRRRLGDVAAARGDRVGAREAYAQAEALAQTQGDRVQQAFAQVGLAEVSTDEEAARWLASASALAAQVGAGPTSELGRRIAAAGGARRGAASGDPAAGS